MPLMTMPNRRWFFKSTRPLIFLLGHDFGQHLVAPKRAVLSLLLSWELNVVSSPPFWAKALLVCWEELHPER